MTQFLACAAATLVLSGCAANDPSAAQAAAEKRYATGSNLPLRDRNVKVLTAEELEQLRNSSSANTGRPRAN